MELQFDKENISCLDRVVGEVQNLEQTQEIRLSDGMPDVGRVLAAWGQCIMRNKEWRSDSVLMSGGMMIWVLYMPENDSGPRAINTWIPFQMSWDLPDDVREGTIRIGCRLRFADARSVSPRKIMVRAGAGVMCEAYSPVDKQIAVSGEVPEDVHILEEEYLLRLSREAGEKAFVLEEELTPSQTALLPEEIVYYTIQPEITDQKVLGNKLAFRGNGNLHVLYSGEEGQLDTQDYLLPFSQIAEISGGYGSDARGNVRLCPTNLELDLDEQGTMHLKCGLVGQYLIDDVSSVKMVTDAYSPNRSVNLYREEVMLPAKLDERREKLCSEQTIQADALRIADAVYLPDYPRQRRTDSQVLMEMPGTMQMLYYGEGNVLQAASQRMDSQLSWNADQSALVTAEPQKPADPQIAIGNGTIAVHEEMPVELSAVSGTGASVVSGMELGELQQPNPERPSLILRRAMGESLWSIARHCGSTPDAIRKANDLEDEPRPGQMLIIPVN